MKLCYTDERNAQIVVALLKAHRIKKIIASPGTTDICLVASLTHDGFFEIYSSPEERSAGYMACGLSAESGEPVVIICTGATASRNYLPALTEAYYRKLPILAITCSRRSYRIGHNHDQVTDRTQPPKDTVKISVQVPLVYDYESEWNAVVNTNNAILELRHHDSGPVHINLETNYSVDYSTEKLPDIRVIKRVVSDDIFPEIEGAKKAIFVGSHLKWSGELTECVDAFCEKYDAFVICDHISNYKGKYGISPCVSGQQLYANTIIKEKFDLIIHIGDVHAPWVNIIANSVWRVNPDGRLVDTFRKLRYVFEMSELEFFSHYLGDRTTKQTLLYKLFKEENNVADMELNKISDSLPFSNAWIASRMIKKLPGNSVLHLGIQNSLRFWNCYCIDRSINVYCNVGGFGIDGSMSSVIGASLFDYNKLYFCVLGDLAFFYDLNSLGNRHVNSNIRILLINNGKGTEFKLNGNPGRIFGEETDKYIAAGGHYGCKSRTLVKHFAEDLGFVYLVAETKDQLEKCIDTFVDPNIGTQPILLEAFTDSEDENTAFQMIRTCMSSEQDILNGKMKGSVKKTIKAVVGSKNVNSIKKLIGK